MYQKYIKRALDFCLAGVALLILSPFLLILYLLVLIFMGRPVIFKQKRVGKDCRIFTMYKFRTMTNATDADGNLLPDEKRKTKFGSWLRSSCCDELPELINIIRGDLSIVGPRPLLVEYLPYYTEEEMVRYTVRGGLTQPEVLYDKVFPTWKEQFAYEIEYTRHITFFIDLKIIFKTVKIMFLRVEKTYGTQTRMSLIEERSAPIVRTNEEIVK